MNKFDKQVVIDISKKRNEPSWLLDWRLEGFNFFKKSKEPHWAEIDYKPINYDSLNYYNKQAKIDNSSLKKIYNKMGISKSEQKALLGMATDTVIDSTSVNTTYTKDLLKKGIIFLPFSDAVIQYPDLVKKYIGSVVPNTDNYFAALNAAVFSDGTFVYIPKNVTCPIDLASYFRIETMKIGQFERTLIIADSGSFVSYLEGCSAPRRPNHQLHSGVVEIIANEKATVNYSTVQNWFKGDKNGGGILNFVTKRGICYKEARIDWTQVEVGSLLTWKYPSTILKGDKSSSDFYSLSITTDKQQTDTGTKMIHLGKSTKSNIVSYGLAMGKSKQTFRSIVKFVGKNCSNSSKCDSRIIGNNAIVNTYPKIIHDNGTGEQNHEASTGSIDKDTLIYLMQCGLSEDSAISLIISGMATPIIKRLPMEFLVESKQLIKTIISQGL